MLKAVVLLVVLSTVGLVACDDPPREQGSSTTSAEAVSITARDAAEMQVRTRLRIAGPVHLRAVQVYRQQLQDSLAVCGQINVTGASNDPFLPWVAVVTFSAGVAVRTDLYLAASNTEASRVYLEMIERCFDGGGLMSERARMQRSLPPLPFDSTLIQPTTPSAASSPSSNPAAMPQSASISPPSAGIAIRAVTTTAAHPVNIRALPAGNGAVTRIVPRQSELRVFGEAPGGWFQVGDEQPFGWVHGSMLGR